MYTYIRRDEVKRYGHYGFVVILIAFYFSTAFACWEYGQLLASLISEQGDVWIGISIFTIVSMVVPFLFVGSLYGFVAAPFVFLHQRFAGIESRGAVRSTKEYFETITKFDVGLFMLVWYHALIFCVPLGLLGGRYNALQQVLTNGEFFNIPNGTTFIWNATAQRLLPNSTQYRVFSSIVGKPLTALSSHHETSDILLMSDEQEQFHVLRSLQEAVGPTPGGYYEGGFSGLSVKLLPFLDLDHTKQYFTDRRWALWLGAGLWLGSTLLTVSVFTVGFYCCCRDERASRISFSIYAGCYVGLTILAGLLLLPTFGALCTARLPFCSLDYTSSVTLLTFGVVIFLCIIFFFILLKKRRLI